MSVMIQENEKSCASGVSPESMTNVPATVRASAGTFEPPARVWHPLYWLRKEAGLSLGELGALAGISAQNIQLYENGISQPRISNAFKLARALGVTVDKLFGIPYKQLARDDR